jgi:uncharacterized membrane protein
VKRVTAALAVLAAVALGPAASAQEPAVRAVLFFSTTCGHCEHVINNYLLPVWFPQYGGEPEWFSGGVEGESPSYYLATNGTLEVLLVDVGTSAGSGLFAAAADAFGLQQRGVPFLVVGDTYLIGSADIPEQFPGIIEEGLAAGGIDWPDLPGMQEILAVITDNTTTTTQPGTTTTTAPGPSTTNPDTPTTNPDSPTTNPDTPTTNPDSSSTTLPATTTTTDGGTPPIGGDSPWDRFRRDTVANSLALVLLVVMILSLLLVGRAARADEEAGPPGLGVALLSLAGLAVAIYLAFVETSGSEAVCGPVGDCNAVQQSEWAQVFGIHIGVIGVAGYALVLLFWGVARFAASRPADWARVALFAGAAAGTGFSVYLTFLEPFVIGATCLWCLASAVIVTALMWLTARPAAAAWARLRAGD